MNVRVKICGITSLDDSKAAMDAGADAIGLNFVPSSPRRINEEEARKIRIFLQPFVQLVGVFVDEPPSRVLDVAELLDLHFVQLHGSERDDETDANRISFMKKIKAIRVKAPSFTEELKNWKYGAHIFLLDGPGGGKTFDWSLVARARELTTRPIIVAGGLTIDNVAACVRATRPFAVDVASGVESSPGVKDAKLMREFVKRAKAAGAELCGSTGSP